MKLDELRRKADVLISGEGPRNNLYEGVDDVFYGRWNLPPGMPEWVQKVVMMDGYDAVSTATRVMSQWKNLRVKVLPMQDMDAARDRANQIETALKWNLMSSMRRSETNILHDTAFSAVQYAMTANQIVYLPYQEKVMEAMGKSTNRIKFSRKFGDFAFESHHPANVYPYFTMYGLEGVLVVKVQTLEEFKAEWGELAKKIDIKKGDTSESYVSTFDWWDYDRRVTWAIQTGTRTVASNTVEGGELVRGDVILDDKNELGFIPFAIRRWGNSLSSLANEKVRPMLKSMWDSGQYDMLNVYASLTGTLAWKRAAAPVGEHQSATGDKLKLDYTEPVAVIESGPGEKYIPLPPERMDVRLENELEKFRGMIWQSTVARQLQSLDFPGGAAFSTVDRALSAAVASLSPYKTLVEQTLSDMLHLMLCSVRYYGDKFGKVNLYGEYGGEKAGNFVSIPSDTIAPEALRIEVEMTPDVPLDEQARANTAIMLYRDLGIPASELVENIGFGDPRVLFDKRAQEDIERSVIEVEVQRPLRELEQEYQERTMQMQAGIQQQQQQQQQQMALEEQQAMVQNELQNQAAAPVTEALGGLGRNPAAGGLPPAQGAPGQL